jgi:hypothetical protein
MSLSIFTVINRQGHLLVRNALGESLKGDDCSAFEKPLRRQNRFHSINQMVVQGFFRFFCISSYREGITQSASLHIALTTSNLYPFGHAYFSPLRLAADITDFSSNIVDGKVHAPKSPGLGIAIQEEVLDAFKTRTEILKAD